MLNSSGMRPRDIGAFDDTELLARADDLFCACAAGRAMLAMIRNRHATQDQWVRNTERQQREAAERNAANAFGMVGIPPRFLDLTWASLRNKAGDDPGKAAAMSLAYQYAQHGHVDRDGIKKLSLLVWSRERGVGKTGLMTAVFKQAIKRRPGLWVSFGRLTESVRAGYNGDGDAYRVLAQARDIPVLLLDEVGENWREDATAHTVQVLNSVLYHRHAYDMPTFYTSNKSPDELARMFGEEHWQRIAEMAAVVEMGGRVLRSLG